MPELNTDIVERFVGATTALLTIGERLRSDHMKTTVLFSHGTPGWVTERDLALINAEEDLDCVHLQFEPEREAEGPVNVMLCENRDGTILTWPLCDLWSDGGGVLLVVPKNQDFGFAHDGAALVRVTGLTTGAATDRGVALAKDLVVMAAAMIWRDDP